MPKSRNRENNVRAANRAAVLIFIPLLILFTAGFCCDSFAANSSSRKAEKTSDVQENTPAVNTATETDIPVNSADKPDPNNRGNKQDKIEDEDFDFLEETAGPAPLQVADPIAPFNKAMFYFNDKLYFWFLKPITQGYTAIFP